MTLKNKLNEIIASDAFGKFQVILCAALAAAGIARYLTFSTANIFTLLFAILMLPLFRAAFRVRDKKVSIASVLLALFFTAALFMQKYEWLTFQDKHAARYTIELLVGLWLFFKAFTAVLLDRMRDFRINTPGEEPPQKKRIKFFFAAAGIMFVCWLPHFMLGFPGEVTSDSLHQLNQMVGNEPLSNHHPIAHTYVIKFFFSIGKAVFHDDNRAVATYVVCQMILLAFAFSYLLTTMYRLRVRKLMTGAVLACFALLSYHGAYSITIWKDIPFAAFVVCYSVTLWRILLHFRQGAEKLPLFEGIMLFLTGIGVCLFRSNGLYAYMLTTVFIVIFCIRRRKPVMLGITVSALAVSLIVTRPVYNALGIQKPEPLESLALPQQMIGAVLKNERPMTQEQLDLIANVADIQGLKDNYFPNSADGIKVYVWEHGNEQYVAEHKSEFFHLWLDLGKKYPKDYIIATVYQTLGYWFPDVQNWVYSGEFRYDGFDLHRESAFSDETTKKLLNLREEYREIYFLGLFWSIGTAVWVAVFMMGAAFTKRRLPFLLIFLPVMSIWGTLLIAAPVYAEFRYMYSFFSTLPLLCTVPFVSMEGVKFGGRSIPVSAGAAPLPETEAAETPQPADDPAPAEDAADKKADDTLSSKQRKKKYGKKKK